MVDNIKKSADALLERYEDAASVAFQISLVEGALWRVTFEKTRAYPRNSDFYSAVAWAKRRNEIRHVDSTKK
ncbi:hypothetical protein MHH52_07250 [Paenibacillus sp. FSL K6-0276]|uniref:hypothetical protein n=1 Tax=Paenibacillus sp. FSL K6-0276 TaxID=2921450 RepID=UPI0030EB5817